MPIVFDLNSVIFSRLLRNVAANVIPNLTISYCLSYIAESDSCYCDTCYRSVVCPSVCRLSHSCTTVKPSDGMRCHLARTLVRSQVTLYYTEAPVPYEKGDLGFAKLLWPLLLPRDTRNAKRVIAIVSRPSIRNVDVSWAYRLD